MTSSQLFFRDFPLTSRYNSRQKDAYSKFVPAYNELPFEDVFDESAERRRLDKRREQQVVVSSGLKNRVAGVFCRKHGAL